MYKPTVTDADLARLQAERDQADRAYNDALSALDRALTAPGALPGAPPPDTSQLDRLGAAWQVIPAEPVPFTGWRGRLGAFVWRIVGPMLQRQQEFNAALLDHAHRSAESARQASDAIASVAAAVGAELGALATMQSRLIGYLQQVTLYVDTKDRYEAGLLWHELRMRTEGLSAGLSAIGDELLKGREHALLAEQRLDARLQEGLARLAGAARAGMPGPIAAPAAAPAPPRAAVASEQLATDGASQVYAGFEDLYRGSTEEIRDRLAEYLPLFEGGGGPVVDLGCGRGEFLAALRDHGIPGRGVDINPAMVERCRAAGLDVVQEEALAFLAGLPDASMGGIMAAQVVEHLPPEQLLALLDAAWRKLRPGGRIVLETVNPACWAAFFSSYIRDITHVRPIHPDTLRYLLIARDFQDVDIRYSSPYPQAAKLHALPLTLVAEGSVMTDLVREFNRNVEILNGQLFTYLDYAALGVKA